jgi:hypothetical protein
MKLAMREAVSSKAETQSPSLNGLRGRVCRVGLGGLMMLGLVVPSSSTDSWPSVVMTSPVAFAVVLGMWGRSTRA